MNTLPPFTSDAQILAIGEGLFDRTLPKSEWTHRGHFAATLWLLARRPDLSAARDLPPRIRAYNEATGVANTDRTGYHETITQASIRAARSFRKDHADLALFECCNALGGSPLGQSKWLFEYWSFERLMSVAARRHWVDSDLKTFPF